MNYSVEPALQPYIRALRRTYGWLLLFGAAGALLAFAITSTIKPAYESHFSYLVALSDRESVDEFRFDGYYALQATDLFAATLAGWVQSPEVIVAALRSAELDFPSEDPRQLGRLVRAQKVAPQLVQVTVRYSDKEFVSKLVGGLQAVMDANIDRYHDEGIPALTFRAVTTEPWQGSVQVARGVITGATFIFVVFIGANIVLLTEALREQRQSAKEIKSLSKW